MRQTLSKGIVVAAAATGMLSLYGGSAAFADTRAHGAAQGSPGLLSGNDVQVPVDVPVNVCGNSVDAAAALNPVFGNSCATGPGSEHRAHGSHRSQGGHGGSRGSHGSPHRHAHGGSDAPSGDDLAGYDFSGHGFSGYDFSGHGDSGNGDSGRHFGHGDFGGCSDLPSPGPTSAPPSYGEGETTPPPHGGGEKTPPGSHHSTPPPGGRTTSPPAGGRSAPPAESRTIPPYHGGGEHRPGQPPALAHTGGDARTMFATSAASATLIAAGAMLYRRGRAAALR
ncbi:chaplin [Streptomyces broussonetiae]|uniref:chaplin n=1 Tax=Streptomyces broussonetiae TaxID=2686304 RepID=UPI0035E12DF5